MTIFGSTLPCAAIVQLLGFPDQLVFWSNSSSVTTDSKQAPGAKPEFLAHSLRLEGHGKLQALAAGEALEVTALPPLGSVETAPAAEPSLLGWSGQPRSQNALELIRRETLPDGCLSLALGMTAEAAWPLYLCLPDWAFPFQVGEMLRISVTEEPPKPGSGGAQPSGGRYLRLGASGDALPEVELWLNAEPAQVRLLGSVTALDAPAQRTSCGAYATPLAVELPALKATLSRGDEAELSSAGVRTRALLGRADDVLVAPPDCSADYSSLGSRFDLLLLKTREEVP